MHGLLQKYNTSNVSGTTLLSVKCTNQSIHPVSQANGTPVTLAIPAYTS